MKELLFMGLCGSLRRASRNRGLLRACAAAMPEGCRLEMADIAALPLYNEDMEKPAAALELARLAASADGFVLACPEYNYSLAPALKNALDWLSREPAPTPLDNKPACVLGAGGGMGTSRSQYHLRQVAVCLNLHMLDKPEFFANAFSPAFTTDGDLVDERLLGQVKTLMQALADWTRRLAAR